MQETLELLVRPKSTILTSTTISDLLEISPNTWRGWVSRKQAPRSDGNIDSRTPYWKLTTIVEYLKAAPGGRLPYQVG